MSDGTPSFPASLSIDYPDHPLNKITTLFRIFTIIPIAIVLSLLTGAGYTYTVGHVTHQWFASGGIVIFPLILMLLFVRKYPRWWFNWNLELTCFTYRVSAYLALLRDEYPSTDEEQAVHLDLVYPDAKKDLNQAMPLVKWLLAFPHYIVLFFLGIAAFVCVIIAWFVILFTGRYPKGLFDFVVGVMRWGLRVSTYAMLLITDRYPPFSLS